MTLVARPCGVPAAKHFAMQTVVLPTVGPGEVLAEVQWLGFQPSQLKALQSKENACMKDEVELGAVPPAFGIATVVEADEAAKFAVGDLVWGATGWRSHVVWGPKDFMCRKLDSSYPHPSHFLSVLGMTSFTAYFGLELAKLAAGEAVVVSAAAGAVGQVVCQLAKRAGCFVLGLTSSEAKAALLPELGCNAVVVTSGVDEKGLRSAVAASLPNGELDVFWDNVGGATLDMALGLMKNHARIMCCGRISAYLDEPYALRNYEQILVKQARVEGFLVTDYHTRFPEATKFLAQLVATGEIRVHEDVTEGLGQCPEALAKLFTRESVGKVLVRL